MAQIAPLRPAGPARPAAPPLAAKARGDHALIALVVCVAATVILYAAPFGRLFAYPLILLSTLAHEMGHGIGALLAGGNFDSFHMWSNASGLAHVSGLQSAGGAAFMTASGLCGPACAAALLFLAARRERVARGALFGLGALLLILEVLVVRGAFGMAFVAVLIGACLLLGWKGRGWVPRYALVFTGVQLALSVFSRGDYLFTREAQTGAGVFPSDVSNMATALGGPYWLWGLACGAFSVAVLLLGVWLFVRARRRLSVA